MKTVLKQLFAWRVWRWILGGLTLAFAAIQLVPVDRSNPPVEVEVPASDAVRAVLRRACYDCHSNETVWPAYSRIAPLSWLVADHVREGRAEFNFSTWSRLEPKKRAKVMREIPEVLDEGEMPLPSYLRLHPEAVLSAADVEMLRGWAESAGALSE